MLLQNSFAIVQSADAAKKHSKVDDGRRNSKLFAQQHKMPTRTVLIKRSTKEDLIMAKRMKALGLPYPMTSNFHTTNDARPNTAFATVQYNRHNFRAKTTMNGWAPSTSAVQASYANLWITNGPIHDISVLQDGWGDGEWWLKIFNQFVGYWPQKVFVLYGGANNVVWGGQVFSPANEPRPAVGSRHFPKDGLQNKAAYLCLIVTRLSLLMVLSRVSNSVRGHVFGRVAFIAVADKTDAITFTAGVRS
ncbi:hypothetical protein F3Y22_tig00110584pilonHSYRG00470 [Hibiscus syriacus]|uniref:Neprosin PEP catalytic domain-containing protein n=1 Tax=Hibiscus syriacus TaxID=106335 RepID=A0A6A3A4M7_HIBSY|nr:hypothetical protein F3Y22_tig00110584pilonHSYRG00470 [Hibiscus syriacus]